jgi:hypothetical protein
MPSWLAIGHGTTLCPMPQAIAIQPAMANSWQASPD